MQIANSVHVLQYSRESPARHLGDLERVAERILRISLERVAGLQRAAGAERACLFARSESKAGLRKHDTGTSPK